MVKRRDFVKFGGLGALPLMSSTAFAAALPSVQSALTVPVGATPQPKDFGARGDGVANDTEAVQRAALASSGGMTLTPGKTYLIDKLIIPNRGGWTLDGCGATLKKRDDGDNHALVMSENHAKNAAVAGADAQIRNLRLDRGKVGAACSGIVLQSWNSRLFNLAVRHMSGDGIRMAGITRDGTPLKSTLVNNWIDMVVIDGCGGHGIHIDDPKGNKCSEWYLGGGWIYGCKGWGIYAREMAGAQVGPKMHLYANKGGGLYAGRWSIGTVIQGLILEAGQTLKIPGGWRTGILAQCYFYGDARLEIGFAAPGNGIHKRVVVNQCHFTGKSHILHQGGPDRTIELIGCLFDDPDPLRKERGGAYFATRCWADKQDKLLDGAL